MVDGETNQARAEGDAALTVVIPAYNEEASLETVMPDLLAFCEAQGYRLIIVNDGSSDATGAVLGRFAEHACLEVVTNKVNRGYGGAIKAGIARARTPYVITIDADGQHQHEDIIALHDELVARNADMIVGGRPRLPGESLYRRIGKKLIRTIARMLLTFDIRDLNSGMKIYDTELAQRYMQLCPDSMAYSDIITLVFISQRHLVLEHPITIKPRTSGVSTISTMTALETVREILNIVVLFNPMKVFFPIALVLGVSGIAWGLPIVLAKRGVSVGALLGLVSGLIFFFLGLMAEQVSLMRKASVTRR